MVLVLSGSWLPPNIPSFARLVPLSTSGTCFVVPARFTCQQEGFSSALMTSWAEWIHITHPAHPLSFGFSESFKLYNKFLARRCRSHHHPTFSPMTE